VSVSGALTSQKGPAIFQKPESFKKVQFQAQEIFNVCLVLEFEVKLIFNKKMFFKVNLCSGFALDINKQRRKTI
jgi:hypothetical protein